MPLEGDPRNPLTYLAYDIMTGNLLAELPLNNVSFGQRLNMNGSFKGDLDLLDPRVKSASPSSILQPGRTAVFVDYLGDLIWGGIIWTLDFSRSAADKVSLGGQEIFSYFSHRVQAKNYDGTTWPGEGFGVADPQLIAATVLDDALAVSGSAFAPAGGIPMTVSTPTATPVGSWINVSYPSSQLQTVDTIVTNLSQMGYTLGFDFTIVPSYSATGKPQLLLQTAYPREGRIADQDSVTIVTQSAHDYSYPQDSSQQAGTIYATGTGSAQVQTSIANPQVITSGWPLMEKVNSYTNILDVGVLTQIATGDLELQSFPITTPTVTLPMFGDPSPLAYGIGDDVRWIIEPDERFPGGLDWFWRIVAIDYTPKDAGLSTVKLTFNLPPGTGAVNPPT